MAFIESKTDKYNLKAISDFLLEHGNISVPNQSKALDFLQRKSTNVCIEEEEEAVLALHAGQIGPKLPK